MSSKTKGPVFKPNNESHTNGLLGRRSNYEWNRLSVTDWERSPFKLERKRTYEDKANTKLRREAWILAVRLGKRQRVLAKYERDLQTD